MKENPVFQFVSVEEMVKKNQREYYQALGIWNRDGNSTAFIEFSLKTILSALNEYGTQSTYRPNDSGSRLNYVKEKLAGQWFKRRDYQDLYPEISAPTASRDLLWGVQNQVLKITGVKNQTQYCFF